MKRALIIFLIIIGVLIGIRLALEPIAEHYANRSLNNMEGYSGNIRDIDINLLRGAYRIEGIEIQQTNDSISTPFITMDTLDLSVHWDALLDGKITGEVVIYRPVVNFVSEKEGDQKQTGEDTDWVAKLKEFMPLTINRFEIRDGDITFRDPSVKPQVDIQLKDLFLVAQNLSNVQKDSADDMPATLSASATSIGGGQLDLDMKMDFLNEIPEFDAQLKFMSVDLTQLNDFIKAYANFDVKEGMFSLITEMRVDNGKITGYIKPFFENLNIFSLEQENKQDEGFFRKAWEALVGLGAELFENQPQDRVATEVPIQGEISSPDVNVTVTIFNIFKNAFVDAIEKEFERRSQDS